MTIGSWIMIVLIIIQIFLEVISLFSVGISSLVSLIMEIVLIYFFYCLIAAAKSLKALMTPGNDPSQASNRRRLAQEKLSTVKILAYIFVVLSIIGLVFIVITYTSDSYYFYEYSHSYGIDPPALLTIFIVSGILSIIIYCSCY